MTQTFSSVKLVEVCNYGYKMSSFWRKKDSFYVILKRKYSFGQDSNPRSMDNGANSTTTLSDLLMNGHIKVAYIKCQIPCLYAIVTK